MNQMMNNEMGGEMPAEGQNGGYCIEIRVNAEGAISVSSAPLQEEVGEGESSGKPAKSIGEAIKIAMDIYENSGNADAGEEDFSSGFGSEQPAPMMIREGE